MNKNCHASPCNTILDVILLRDWLICHDVIISLILIEPNFIVPFTYTLNIQESINFIKTGYVKPKIHFYIYCVFVDTSYNEKKFVLDFINLMVDLICGSMPAI